MSLNSVFSALTSMIRLEDKVKSQSETIKSQQLKIENLVERVIRLETQMEMILQAAALKRLQN